MVGHNQSLTLACILLQFAFVEAFFLKEGAHVSIKLGNARKQAWSADNMALQQPHVKQSSLEPAIKSWMLGFRVSPG